jgi:hypothetical protein
MPRLREAEQVVVTAGGVVHASHAGIITWAAGRPAASWAPCASGGRRSPSAPWELFALGDAAGSRDGPFHRFGVVRDDYTPEPAFERLRRTIAELRSA